MKTISSGMASHLAQEVTTLCTCWKIVRTDGEVFGFTDHDMDLAFDGIVYESETGYNRTAIRSDASFSVDNLDVNGFLDSDRISENDLRNGVFDFASVYIFAVNWDDLTQNEIKLRRGWFGEVTLNQNGMFETEIRGLHQALSFGFMESYQPECRADFCDSRCALNKADFTHNGTVFTATSRSVFQASSLPTVAITGATSAGSHRYWRIQVVTTYYTNYTGFDEIKFFDQSDAAISGGTASAMSVRAMTGGLLGVGGTTYHADHARDGTIGSSWECKENDAPTAWWEIDFGSGNDKDIKSLLMRVCSDDYHLSPTAFYLQFSDDGTSWANAKLCEAHWTNSGQEATWTLGSATSDPVDYPTSLDAIPPPFTGMSTYVGGDVTFNTGPNTGRSIEIVDFDAGTSTVTMFEDFAYPISAGDQFTITQGCDKRFTTCQLYANQNNFRGEPQVPGQDEYLSYPDSHD